jgi:hypothetical protein
MTDTVKLRTQKPRRPRPVRQRSSAEWERVKRLRIVARKLGYEVVSPWCAEQRNIPGHGPYLLVRHGTGLNIDEIEEIIRANGRMK